MKQTFLSICLSLVFATSLQAQTFAQNQEAPAIEAKPLTELNYPSEEKLADPRPLQLRRIPRKGTPVSLDRENQDRTSEIVPLPEPMAKDAVPYRLMTDLEEAASNFKERYPKTKVLGFSLTPVKGIYEATVGKEVVYFDKSARFLFTGRLLDLEKGIDLTDAKLREIRRVDISKLPLDLAIKQVKGTGERQLILFTDVDCPFSRRLFSTLDNVDDVTIWTFLFPLTSIHPEAKAKSDSIWCSKDSLSALDAVMNGENIDSSNASPLCNSPVGEIIRLGAELGIGGTPTIINGAGDRTAGAIPLDKLEAFISAGTQRKEK